MRVNFLSSSYISAIKIICILFIGLLIYSQIFHSDGRTEIINFWQLSFKSHNGIYLYLTIVLMPLNWALETYKFRMLMSPYLPVTFRGAFSSVMAGVALGIVTPARMGEYAGRLITMDANKKTEVVSATLLGSIAQNLCNIIFGLALSYFFLKSTIYVTYTATYTFIVVVFLQICILIWVYYHLPCIGQLIQKIGGTRLGAKLSEKLTSLTLYTPKLLNQVLTLSVMRYTVYFFQYFCILRYFGVDKNVEELGSNIASIYMIQTGIPLPAFLSIMARGELAVLVWDNIGVNKVTALAATFGLWFINLIIPALLGLGMIYKSDIHSYIKKSSS